MATQTVQTSPSQTAGEAEISGLYRTLLEGWNRRSAHDFAAHFTDGANVIGFDGSQMNGRAEIEAELSRIFADHQTSAYIAKVREVRFLTPEVAVLQAVVGMIPSGKSDLNPAVNAIQILVATKQANQWRITLLQSTPAQFHGRPDLSEALTAELRELL
jgi:uncharacterized protein (TIGR02246 family)